MTALAAVTRRALDTVLRSSALLALYAAIAILAVTATVTLTGVLALAPLAAADPDSPGIGMLLGITGVIAAFVTGGLVFTVLLGAPLTREQTTGRVILLAASPAGARRLWLGQALALWIVSLVGAILAGSSVILAMRAIWAPDYPLGGLDAGLIATMLALVPLALLGLSLTATAIGLGFGAIPGSIAANIGYIGTTTTMGRMAGSGLDTAGYALAWAILAAVLLTLGAAGAALVTRERTVLACR